MAASYVLRIYGRYFAYLWSYVTMELIKYYFFYFLFSLRLSVIYDYESGI